MSSSSPSLQEWRDLYEAALEFKKLASWKWMHDSDIFGVQNPVNGEIGYCCIMGNLGEVFGSVVYLGTEGLAGYLKIQSGKISPDDIDVLHLQKCLSATFKDREFLQKQDLQTIRKLGLKFRGPNSWPLFRSYRPGYHPWYLTNDEVRYLTLALQQATEVCLRFKKDRDMLTPFKENHLLIRVPERKGKGLNWADEWLKPAPLEKVKIVLKPIDEIRLMRIKKKAFRQQGIWETDFFYSPTAVREKGERPYYPYVFLWVDQYSAYILNLYLATFSEYRSEFQEKFLSLIEKIKLLPEETWVKKKEVFKLVEPITSGLGIELRLVKRLEMLEEAQASMFEYFR